MFCSYSVVLDLKTDAMFLLSIVHNALTMCMKLFVSNLWLSPDNTETTVETDLRGFLQVRQYSMLHSEDVAMQEVVLRKPC